MPSNFHAKGAAGYEASMGRWSRRLAHPFLRFAGVLASGRVLDAGCGTGSLTLALALNAGLDSIAALDFEPAFVDALRQRTNDPRIEVRQGDICALPFGDGSFDAVYSLLVLHFVADPGQAVREMRRVLHPGATAAAAVWAHGGLFAWRLFWEAILALEPGLADRGLGPSKRPLTGEGELAQAFASAGFASVVEARIEIRMDFANFDDFWNPMVYGQGRFGSFYDDLPALRRERLRAAVKAAYLAGRDDGPRDFIAQAWAASGRV